MPSTPLGASLPTSRPTFSRLATIVLTTALACSGVLGVAPHASATPAAQRTASSSSTTSSSSSQQAAQRRPSAAQRFQTKAERVLRVTRYHKGDPYVYGAAGPHSFDCSGLVMFVFRRALGRSLPHYAESQWQESHHIRRSAARPGDLVFQLRGNYAFHVGIYAGHGYMWDAPHSGAHVHRHLMYRGRWGFGRLIRS